jgi:hypothetical protein
MLLAVLFWVFWILSILGIGYYRWPGSASPAFGVDVLIWLLVGMLGLKVFPIAL